MDPSTQSFSSTLRRRIPSLGSRIPAPVQPRARSTSGDGGILQSSSVDTRRRRRTREHSDSDARLSWSGTSTGAGTGDQGQALSLELELELGDPFSFPTHTSADTSEGAPLSAASAPVTPLSHVPSRPIQERSHGSSREPAGSSPERTAVMDVVQQRQDAGDEGPHFQGEAPLLPLPASLSWPLYDPLTGEWSPHSLSEAADNASRQTQRATSVSSASSYESQSLQTSHASGEHPQASSTSLPPRLAPLHFSFEQSEAAETAIVHTTAMRPREVVSTSRLRHKRPVQRASPSPPALTYNRSDVSGSASPSGSSSRSSPHHAAPSGPETVALLGEESDVRYDEVLSTNTADAGPASTSTTLDFFHMYSIPPLGTTSASSAIAMPHFAARPDTSFTASVNASATTSAHRHSPPAAAELGARVKRRRSGTRNARNEDDDESFVALPERSVRRASSRSTVNSSEMGESAMIERYPSRTSVSHPFARTESLAEEDGRLASFSLDSSASDSMPGASPAEPAVGALRTREQTPLTRYIDTLLANEDTRRAGVTARPRTLQQHLTGTDASTTRAASPTRLASPHALFETSQAQPVSPVVATVTAVPSLPLPSSRPSLARSSPSVSERRGNEAPFSLGLLPRFHFDAATDGDDNLMSPRDTSLPSAESGTTRSARNTFSPRGRSGPILSPHTSASTPGIRRPNLQRNATAVSPPEESPLNTPEVDPAGQALTPPTAGNVALAEYPRSSFFRQQPGRASLPTMVRDTATARSAGGAWAGTSGLAVPGLREADSLWQYVWNEEDERRRAEDLLRSFETSRRITDEIRSFDTHASGLRDSRHRLRGPGQRPASAEHQGSGRASGYPLSLLESWESSLPSTSSETSPGSLSNSLASSQPAPHDGGGTNPGLWGTLPAEPISGNLLQSVTSRRADSSSGDPGSSSGSTRSRRPGSLRSGTMRGPTRTNNENWLRSQGIDFHHDSSSTTASAGVEPRSSPFAHGASSTPNHPWRTGRTAPLVGATRTTIATGVSVSTSAPSSAASAVGTAQGADAADRTLRRMPHRPFVPIARSATRSVTMGRDSPRLDGIRPVSPLFEMAEDNTSSSAADRVPESTLTRRQSALWSHLEALRRLIAAPAGAEVSGDQADSASAETTHRHVSGEPVDPVRPAATSSRSSHGTGETDHISGLEAELANIRAMMDQLERNRPVQRSSGNGPTRATHPEAQTQRLLDLQLPDAGQPFWSRPTPVHARGRFVPPSTMTPAGATSRQSRQQGLDSHTDSMRPGASSRQPSTTARQPFDDIFAEVEAEFAGRNLHRTASTPTRRRSRSEMAAALEDASIAERDGDARQTRTTAFMDGLLRGLDYDISPSLIGTDSLSSTGAEVASGSGASITSTPAGYAPQVSGAAPPRLSVDFMDTMGTGWDRLGLDGNHPVFGEEDHPNEDGVADTLFRALNDERRDVWATESMRSLGQNDVDGPFPQDVEGSSDENAMSSGRVPLPPFLLRSIHARRRNIFGNREPGITHTRPLHAGTGGSGIAFESRNYLSDLDLDLSYEGLLALSESIGEARPRGASDVTLNAALRKFLHGANTSMSSAIRVATMSETRCGICLEDYEDGDECAESVKCGHAMHAVCFEGWLRRTANCPICRTSVH